MLDEFTEGFDTAANLIIDTLAQTDFIDTDTKSLLIEEIIDEMENYKNVK
jgi:hypothetical protein